MVRLKNRAQIDGIRASCKMLSAMFREIKPFVKAGAESRELDNWAQNWIRKAGGKPAFLGYSKKGGNPFPAALCISINDEVIHGIPSKRRLKDGDLVGIDCGINLGGFFSDQAISFEIGRVSEEVHRLSEATKAVLLTGIGAAREGERILQIGRAIQSEIAPRGYGIVKDYCGHGVGFAVHKDPEVPNQPKGANPRILNGMVLAIEPMICLGKGDVEVLEDDWTVVTSDGKVSAHWEHTVAIMDGKTETLTEF